MRSCHLAAVVPKNKGGSIAATTDRVRPFCSAQPQRTTPSAASLIFPNARVIAQLEMVNGAWCKPLILWEAENTFFISSLNFHFISNCMEMGTFHNEPFYICL